ncbi:MAG TPA: hypothetical protein VF170_06245 [Planctomycetaceae bacterium]
MRRTMIGLGLSAAAALAFSHQPPAEGDKADPAEVAAVRKALRPLQVVVGRWRGNTFRENVVHEATWAWDHRTDPRRPALVMAAAKNPFFREARLTFDPESETYVLLLTDRAGGTRRLEGAFSEPPADVPGDDGRALQRTYELALEQVEPKTGEQWRVVFDQQENNRFLVELAKRRGRAPFRRFDTVSGQREGTSFALTDEGYGEKTCVISGGLGTTAVTHAGRTYYVCCSGCEAAFKDDPEKWIAEFEKSKTKR